MSDEITVGTELPSEFVPGQKTLADGVDEKIKDYIGAPFPLIAFAMAALGLAGTRDRCFFDGIPTAYVRLKDEHPLAVVYPVATNPMQQFVLTRKGMDDRFITLEQFNDMAESAVEQMKNPVPMKIFDGQDVYVDGFRFFNVRAHHVLSVGMTKADRRVQRTFLKKMTEELDKITKTEPVLIKAINVYWAVEDATAEDAVEDFKIGKTRPIITSYRFAVIVDKLPEVRAIYADVGTEFKRIRAREEAEEKKKE